jgi:hypothetical protein
VFGPSFGSAGNALRLPLNWLQTGSAAASELSGQGQLQDRSDTLREALRSGVIALRVRCCGTAPGHQGRGTWRCTFLGWGSYSGGRMRACRWGGSGPTYVLSLLVPRCMACGRHALLMMLWGTHRGVHHEAMLPCMLLGRRRRRRCLLALLPLNCVQLVTEAWALPVCVVGHSECCAAGFLAQQLCSRAALLPLASPTTWESGY